MPEVVSRSSQDPAAARTVATAIVMDAERYAVCGLVTGELL